MRKGKTILKVLRVIAVLLGLVLLVGVIAITTTSLWVARVANPILTRRLGTPVQVEKVRVRPLRGYAEIQKMQIAQPEGFNPHVPLLTISQPGITIRLSELLKKHLNIHEIKVDKVELHVIRNVDGSLNLEELIAGMPERPPREPKPPRETYPTLTLSHMTVPDALITYSDFTVTPPIMLALTNIQVHANTLLFDTVKARTSTNMPGTMRVKAEILQPDYENGYIGFISTIGITSTNIPAMNAAGRMIGFDIRSIRGLLPPGISTAIGGSNMDVLVDAAVAEEYLRVQNRLQTSGNTYRLGISGTPREPIIDRSTALFNLITRPGAFITATLGGVADAGMAAGRTVVSTAERAGSGIFRGIRNIGRGAAQTATSAARGDIRGIGDGMRDLTYGTVTGAVDTVTSTARGVGDGIGETFSAAAGRTQTRNWESTNRNRWEQRWEEAESFVRSAPFPGTAPVPELIPDPKEKETTAEED